jgi:hypothetical protein
MGTACVRHIAAILSLLSTEGKSMVGLNEQKRTEPTLSHFRRVQDAMRSC